MIDKNQLTEMYEKMRSAALLQFSKAVKGRHSFGQVVLVQKGVLAWSKACGQLHLCAPSPKPLQDKIVHPDCGVDVDDELKNILTGMALKAIEGVSDVNVTGI